MHVERDSQPLFLLLFFSYFVPQNFFRRIRKFLGEKTYVANNFQRTGGRTEERCRPYLDAMKKETFRGIGLFLV